MAEDQNTIAIMLFSELLAADQAVRSRLTRVLPKGMEISHFSVLNSLIWHADERTPAELAQTLNVTRGAMTNTLSKLEWAGYVHIRPDWDDARRKKVGISPAGRHAHVAAVTAITPMINDVVASIGADKVRETLPIIREIRLKLGLD
ncbi:MarR family winged helix-turn-helix transcriptional regulator [Sulfitobacter aestuariivivens]|uniref:MarR family transcriptional regulator n=1 Tax=Sulfitobacter aestuariivivens TaxID=2766981 RepID=A0A927D814_9RHOB|nr:MarR family transcriptional regulator [Sulfitobacter aestuariivivens]MBD3665267.1 MarR family transcriptional regulator [Sulfitobacter aestuariivivens]